MGGIALFEHGNGQVEVDPFGNTKGELAGMLHRFEDQPVVPGAEVLDGGDSVSEGVADRELQCFGPGVGIGRWDVLVEDLNGADLRG